MAPEPDVRANLAGVWYVSAHTSMEAFDIAVFARSARFNIS